ncbi:hypothetical protein FA95DRAFT_865180 [Auriscalpium vulgare]|uniref:Uncharacterized protein n=1 Tax=Auriscalpium vulgare TaxID=40419 RepID=A0ACB8R9E8_9AGAM|nr:hypothetical protein FA95DRAFT_865180 [Auriscalpium vulgare]
MQCGEQKSAAERWRNAVRRCAAVLLCLRRVWRNRMVDRSLESEARAVEHHNGQSTALFRRMRSKRAGRRCRRGFKGRIDLYTSAALSPPAEDLRTTILWAAHISAIRHDRRRERHQHRTHVTVSISTAAGMTGRRHSRQRSPATVLECALSGPNQAQTSPSPVESRGPRHRKRAIAPQDANELVLVLVDGR